jgi:hypothetical protein
MTIKLITFKTNHTILGDVSDSDDFDSVSIKEPVQVVAVPPSASNPEGGIAFSPFLEYSEEFKTCIKVNKVDILTITHPVVELQNQYNRIFGSGIQIASSIS